MPSVAAFIFIFYIGFFWTGNNTWPCWKVGENYQLVFLVHVPFSFATIKYNLLNSVFLRVVSFSQHWHYFILVGTLSRATSFFTISLQGISPPFKVPSTAPKAVSYYDLWSTLGSSPLPLAFLLAMVWCRDFLTQSRFSLLLQLFCYHWNLAHSPFFYPILSWLLFGVRALEPTLLILDVYFPKLILCKLNFVLFVALLVFPFA